MEHSDHSIKTETTHKQRMEDLDQSINNRNNTQTEIGTLRPINIQQKLHTENGTLRPINKQQKQHTTENGTLRPINKQQKQHTNREWNTQTNQ